MMGQLTEQEIDALLTSQQFGHMGCCEDSKPYVFPMAFAYHEGVLYGQTTVGKKVEMLRRNPHVCFQVQDVQTEYWHSVQCWGNFEELDFEKLESGEASRIVQLLSKHLGSIQKQVGVSIQLSSNDTPVPVRINDREMTIFRIVITEKSGLYRKDWDKA